MSIVLQIVGWALTIPLVLGLGKAGLWKLTSPIDSLAAAGLAWVKEIPTGLVRLIAILEILGVAGIVLAPAADQFLGFKWAAIWGVLAASGLALTMLVAAVMHIVRGEFKYTWKNNVSLFAFAAVLAGVLAALPSVA
ncbi:MAG: hypothetical protein RLZZ06_485 [Actinomycetota bacterium]|jgi:hypothetical protein